jgi:nucleotidyltransferase/DNA polymerase involved in DNA repair
LFTLPVGRIQGVGKVTEARMASAGIKHVGDIYAMRNHVDVRSVRGRLFSAYVVSIDERQIFIKRGLNGIVAKRLFDRL